MHFTCILVGESTQPLAHNTRSSKSSVLLPVKQRSTSFTNNRVCDHNPTNSQLPMPHLNIMIINQPSPSEAQSSPPVPKPPAARPLPPLPTSPGHAPLISKALPFDQAHVRPVRQAEPRAPPDLGPDPRGLVRAVVIAAAVVPPAPPTSTTTPLILVGTRRHRRRRPHGHGNPAVAVAAATPKRCGARVRQGPQIRRLARRGPPRELGLQELVGGARALVGRDDAQEAVVRRRRRRRG